MGRKRNKSDIKILMDIRFGFWFDVARHKNIWKKLREAFVQYILKLKMEYPNTKPISY